MIVRVRQYHLMFILNNVLTSYAQLSHPNYRQGSPYSKTHFFDVYNKEHQLLTPAEMEELSHHDMDNSGLCMKELCTWCQEDVVEARKAGYLDSYQEKLMHDRILAFRAAMDGMYDCK